MRYLLTLIFTLGFIAPASAQEPPGLFSTYTDYEDYLVSAAKDRRFGEMLVRLGGGDEYTPEQVAQLQAQLDNIFPRDFDRDDLVVRDPIGNGYFHEIRTVYRAGTLQYLFIYCLLHQRDDALIVLNFAFNTSAQPIFGRL
ncbi:MAG: hypothetical protein AAF841_10780 [Pseudomonadota bacterium]